MSTEVLCAARNYLSRGLSVIPIRADGTKAPSIKGWSVYKDRRATDEELVEWWGNDHVAGIGVCGGPASGNLAVLDFEEGDGFAKWREAIDAETTDFLDICPIVATPSGGTHVWCRLAAPADGCVLARRADRKVKIEVRGQQHQVLAPGCPPSCHKSGKL